MSHHSCSNVGRRQGLKALAGLGLGCSPGLTPVWAAPTRQADTLQIVAPWEVGGLSAARSGHLWCRLQLCETLVDTDDQGSLQPGLALRWSASVDGRTWRFVLRPNARFHDGSPVTAAAVARSLEAARQPPSVLAQADVLAIEPEGALTVRFQLRTPHAGLPGLLTHSTTLILGRHGSDGQLERLIGTGPYRIKELQPPQRLVMEAFDGYDGPLPPIRHVHYLAASRSETRALMAQSGQADLAYGLDPVSLSRLRRQPDLRVSMVTLPRVMIVKVNAGMPSLRDVRVRQALSLAVDREGMARALLRDPGAAATQLLPPSVAGWHDVALSPLRHDLSAATRLLQAAGWQRQGLGWRDAQGQEVSLSLRTYPDRPELPLMATALQAQWQALGIPVQVQVGNSGDIPLGHRDGSLQLALAARNYGTVPNPGSTLLQDFGAAGSDWGAMGWRHGAVSEALHLLDRGVPSKRQAEALRRSVVQVLQHELPVIPIAWMRLQVAVGARVEGVSLDPLERSYRVTRMRWRG